MSRFFENEMEFGMNMSPNDFYRGTQQAFVNDQWENTAVEEAVEEQDYIGADTYHKVSVWVSKTIGATSTFMKNGQDFRTLLYRKLDYRPVRGTYFKFEDNWWIADFTNPADGVMGDVGIRRCTNYLKIIDPENGSVFSIPCVLDYDMTSPSPTITNSIITPNNHANVIVQANPDTMRLFTYNKRFILNGRAFKIVAFQNALYTSISEKVPTILYLDMILDELHEGDDVKLSIANNGEYNYAINSDVGNMIVPISREDMQVNVTVTLNGEQVFRPYVWKSLNSEVAYCQDDIIHFGSKGTTILTVSLVGNPEVYTKIRVTVASKQDIVPVVAMSEPFDSIRQYEIKSTSFTVNGKTIHNIRCEFADEAGSKYLRLITDNEKLTVKCLKPTNEIQTIIITGISEDYGEVTEQFNISALSLMG